LLWKKANFSASFNLEKLMCNTCTARGEHLVLHREVECTDALDDSPVCFILSDQCFPPLLPVEGEGECLKILLIEDGSLGELIGAFLDLTRGFSVPAGSVVVLASASYLARVGAAAYAAEYVDVGRRLVGAMGGAIELTHGIPILLGGTDDSALIRSLVDLEHWLEYLGGARDITRARRTFFKNILGRDIFAHSAVVLSPMLAGPPEAPGGTGTGTPEATVHQPMSLILPSDKSGNATATFRSTGYVLPSTVPPCTAEQERALVYALIEDINSLYMTNLATEFCTNRDSTGCALTEEDDILHSTRFVLVGASHASRLASALKDLGAEVADLSVPGWRLSEANVEDSAALLREVLEEEWEGDTIVLFQLFDNTSYYAIGPDGDASLPYRSTEDGKYHIRGALGMVDRDTFKKEFSKAVPLLRAGGLHRKLLLSPLIRYATHNCCDKDDHCTNRSTGLNTMLATGLANLETWLDDQAYLKRIRSFSVINPNNFLTSDTEAISKKDAKKFKQLWNGPVHMSDAGYRELAKSIIDCLPDTNFKRSYTSEEKPAEATGKSHTAASRPARGRGRGRVDWATKRQSWVNKSDTVAKRSHEEDDRKFSNRGGYRGRPQRGAGGHWRGSNFRGRYKKFAYKPY
jgi:hypothetical protein